MLQNGGNMLLRAQNGVPDEFRFVDSNGKLFKALDGMLRKYVRGKLKPLMRTAQEFHFGAAECATNAFEPQDGEEGVWQIVVSDCYAYEA